MPSKPMPIFIWRDRLQKIIRRPLFWINPKAVVTAAGLLAITVLLMVTVISGLMSREREKPIEITHSPKSVTATPVAPVEKPKTSVAEKSQAVPSAAVSPAAAPASPKVASQPAVRPKAAADAVSAQIKGPIWPLQGEIKLPFGWVEHPVYKDWRYHAGLDISGTLGQPVAAAMDGKVENVYNDSSYGLTVLVAGADHRLYYYGSLASTRLEKGASLHAGDVIGTVGTTLGESYPHVYWAVKSDGQYLDPAKLVK
ncbi:peptidase m23 [Lucifera butyrica]|uniref:Peptidase m23 n=1 Tax=Lucifera butyrica TaxID=1351585 RepID=A0A498RBZ8_9FIRM|nr:M23 family metallopeptidase [Lucifera butyrica]VBB08911.1 peptidase m23 [Lucifera butyrica]